MFAVQNSVLFASVFMFNISNYRIQYVTYRLQLAEGSCSEIGSSSFRIHTKW